MKWLDTVLILAVALLAVFWEAAFDAPRRFLGGQIHLLPALMVYAGLTTGFINVAVLALFGGLWFDSLSQNQLGVTVLPLLLVGSAFFVRRDLILRSQAFAQMVLGAAASVIVPALSILLLLTLRETPLLGWGTFWQLMIAGIGGAFASPAFFLLFEWIDHTFKHSYSVQSSFRPDREIRRGR